MSSLLPNPLPALREWQLNCDAIAAGRQTLLIRKGGIAEGFEGFTIESHRFALLPTTFHQKHGQPQGGPITVAIVCELLKAIEVPSSTSLESLAAFHQYDPAQLAARINYKPERPLTLMAVRPWRLAQPLIFAADAIQPICRSWHGLPLPSASLDLLPIPILTGNDTERTLLAAMDAIL